MKCIGCILAGAVAAMIALVSGGCSETLAPEAVAQQEQAAPVVTPAPAQAAPVKEATQSEPAAESPNSVSQNTTAPETGMPVPPPPLSPTEASASSAAPRKTPAASDPSGVSIVPVARKSDPAPAGAVKRSASGVNEITFDTIKFEMEKGGEFKREMITPQIEDLVGQKVRIFGFILPTSVFQRSGIRQFVLVRDNQECCFGPGAALYDCVIVRMNPGRTTDFSVRPVAVEGEFKVEELIVNGKTLAIYHLAGDSVK